MQHAALCRLTNDTGTLQNAASSFAAQCHRGLRWASRVALSSLLLSVDFRACVCRTAGLFLKEGSQALVHHAASVLVCFANTHVWFVQNLRGSSGKLASDSSVSAAAA